MSETPEELKRLRAQPEQGTSVGFTRDTTLDSALLQNITPPRTLVYVGGALKPRRDMMSWGDMEPHGWINRFSFGVFRENVLGTVRINIGQAWNPHRVTAAMERSVDEQGWSQKLYFYAWERQQPGTVMVGVGVARNPWRCKFVLGRHIGDFPGEDSGWVEKFVFWAYYN